MLIKIFQPLYVFYVIIVFFVLCIIAFPIVLLAGMSNSILANKNIYYIIKQFTRFWLFLIGMPVNVIGYKPSNTRFVVVINHISYIDSIVILSAIPGYFRPLGKKEMSSIPIFGTIYKKYVIMVDRESNESRAKSMKHLWNVLQNEGSIAIFPEGTFNETGSPLKKFYDGAFQLAIKTQVDILPIIFLDTIDRWHYSAWWKITPGRNRAYTINLAAAGL